MAIAQAQGHSTLSEFEDVISLLRKTAGFMLSSENAERMIDTLQRVQARQPVGYVLRSKHTGAITSRFVQAGEQVECGEDCEWAPVYDLPAIVDPQQAYELGWRSAAEWADRDDLASDIESPAYERDMQAAFERRGKQGA